MSDFGQKRPASQDAVKAKRGRPKKKPDYDKNSKIQEQLEMAVSLFSEPLDDREERSEHAPTIASVAEVMNTTPIRVKKMLITAGYYSTAISRKVQELHNKGWTMQEIMEETGLKKHPSIAICHTVRAFIIWMIQRFMRNRVVDSELEKKHV